MWSCTSDRYHYNNVHVLREDLWDCNPIWYISEWGIDGVDATTLSAEVFEDTPPSFIDKGREEASLPSTDATV